MRILAVRPSLPINSLPAGVEAVHPNSHDGVSFQKHFLCGPKGTLKFVHSNVAKRLPAKRKVCTHCSSGEELGERIIIGDSEHPEKSVRLVCDESGCAVVIGEKVMSEESDIESDYETENESDEEYEENTNRPFYLACDLTGCFFSPDAPLTGMTELKGADWSLKYETAPRSEDAFCAEVSSGGWAVSLTTAEYDNFCKLIKSTYYELIGSDDKNVDENGIFRTQLTQGSLKMESSISVKELQLLKNKFESENSFDSEGISLCTTFTVLENRHRGKIQGYWPAEAMWTMLQTQK